MMAGIVPESWLEWGIGEEEDRAPRPPEAAMLGAHDAVTTNFRKAQQKLGKLVDQGRHATHTAPLDQPPDAVRPPGPGDPLRGCETKAFAKARYRSLQGAGATLHAFGRGQQTRSVSHPQQSSWEWVGVS